jgi:hypothetical protein
MVFDAVADAAAAAIVAGASASAGASVGSAANAGVERAAPSKVATRRRRMCNSWKVVRDRTGLARE